MIIEEISIRQQTIRPSPDDVQMLSFVRIDTQGEGVNDFRDNQQGDECEREKAFGTFCGYGGGTARLVRSGGHIKEVVF